MTVRSFIKRLGALMKYRQAIKDMNRYADATEEDLSRENTCIICREDMHVWDLNDAARIERTRPKKLPCGHILHLGCLKSWMERQQVCPTCRRSVVINDAAVAAAAAAQRNAENAIFRFNVGAGAGAGGAAAPGGGAGGDVPGAGAGANGAGAAANGLPNPGQAPAAAADNPHNHLHGQQPPPAGNGRAGLRMFNFGPFRLGFAQGAPQEVDEIVRRFGLPQGGAIHHPHEFGGLHGHGHGLAAAGQAFGGLPPVPTLPSYSTSAESISADLRNVEDRIERGIIELQIASEEVVALRALLSELQRIRSGQAATAVPASTTPTGTQPETGAAPAAQFDAFPPRAPAGPAGPAGPTAGPSQPAPPPVSAFGYPRPAQTRATPPSAVHLTTDRDIPAIPSGSAELPAGVQIPAGWSLLPLRRFDSSSPSSPPQADTATAPAGPSTSNETASSTPAEATPSSSQRAASDTVEATPAPTAASTAAATTPAAPPIWGGPAQLFGPAGQATVPAAKTESESESEASSSSDSD